MLYLLKTIVNSDIIVCFIKLSLLLKSTMFRFEIMPLKYFNSAIYKTFIIYYFNVSRVRVCYIT